MTYLSAWCVSETYVLLTSYDARFQSYINTAEWLLGRDVPVHGVGVQSHLDGYELNFPVMLVRTCVL